MHHAQRQQVSLLLEQERQQKTPRQATKMKKLTLGLTCKPFATGDISNKARDKRQGEAGNHRKKSTHAFPSLQVSQQATTASVSKEGQNNTKAQGQATKKTTTTHAPPHLRAIQDTKTVQQQSKSKSQERRMVCKKKNKHSRPVSPASHPKRHTGSDGQKTE